MKKFAIFCAVTAAILMILFIRYKKSYITLYIPIKGLVSEDVLFEDELGEITEKYGNFFEDYALSSIRYTRDDFTKKILINI